VERGVVVEGFAANGPARSAGLQKGDRIVRVNGVAIGTQEEFYEQLWRAQAGDVVRLAVERDDRVHVVAVRSVDRARLSPPARD
jgi:serine protease Do